MALCGGAVCDVNIVNRVPHGGSGVMVWAGINYEQRTQLHFIDGSLNAQRYRDEILRPIVVPFIHHHHLMFQHNNACSKDLLYTSPGSWKCPSSSMACIFTRHVTYWACLGGFGMTCTTVCSSSCQYPATSQIHWRGVGQHSTGHNQQPDQLYAKEMCHAAWGKWWSHQILTGFLIHSPLKKRYRWPTDAYLYSQSCEIHRLRPNVSVQHFEISADVQRAI